MWQREKDNLVICLVISLALHLLAGVFIVLIGGFPAFAELFHRKPPPEPEEAPRLVLLQSKPRQGDMAMFQEVDRDQASKEAPKKETPFYSDRNAIAQDQSARSDRDVPDIKGIKSKTIETKTAVPTNVTPPPAPPSTAQKPAAPTREQPAPKQPPSQEPAQESPGQKVPQKQYALLKPYSVQATPAQPDDVPVEAQQAQPPDVPSPEQARAPPAKPQMSERTMKSDASEVTGGISRKGVVALDTRSLPSASYDKIVFSAVGARWRMIVSDRYLNAGGVVLVRFEVLATGEISNVTVVDSGDVGPILSGYCRQAVLDSGPFRPLPENLRALLGDTRKYLIAFEYSFR